MMQACSATASVFIESVLGKNPLSEFLWGQRHLPRAYLMNVDRTIMFTRTQGMYPQEHRNNDWETTLDHVIDRFVDDWEEQQFINKQLELTQKLDDLPK